MPASPGQTRKWGQREDEPETPLPRKKLVAVCIVVISQSFCATLLFPFVGFMVEDLGETKSKEEVGYYAGYLSSAYFLTQVVSGYPWGHLADTWGRRPVLLLGLLGSSIGIILFGFSTSYMLAIIYRGFTGLVDSTVPTIKAYLGDITDRTNKPRGFSYYGLTWGFGSIFGPIVGGLLAQPATKYPAYFSQDGLFGQFPYALPCILSFALGVMSLFICYFMLPESKVIIPPDKPTTDTPQGLVLVPVIPPPINEVDEEAIEDDSRPSLDMEELQRSPSSSALLGEEEKAASWKDDDAWMSDGEEDQDIPLDTTRWQRFRIWLKKYKSLIGAISAYLATCLVFMGFEEVFPLWCMADAEKGGLSYSTSDIGYILLGGGAALIIWQAFCFTRVTKVLGIRNTLITGFILGGLLITLFPSATIFNSIFHGSERYINLWVFIYLTVLMLLRTCCSTSCFTSTNIFVNLAAPRDVGKANGIAFTLAGLVKALVPTAGANILAWSLNSGYPFPFDYHLVFWLLGLTALLGVGVSLTIDAQLERG